MSNVVFVVKHLIQQKILLTLFIIPPSFPSGSSVLPSLFLTGATSICHCRCVVLCVVSVSLMTVALQRCKFLPFFSSLFFCCSVSQMFADKSELVPGDFSNKSCIFDNHAKHHIRYLIFCYLSPRADPFPFQTAARYPAVSMLHTLIHCSHK